MKARRYLKLLDRLNPLIVAILGSWLHWLLSSGLMILKVTGRHSGKTYSIPVGYHDVGEAIVVLVSDAAHRQWWRNFRSPAMAQVRLRGSWMSVEGSAPSPDSAEFASCAEQAFRRAPFIGRIFGIEFDTARGLTAEQHKALAEYARVVVFRRIRTIAT